MPTCIAEAGRTLADPHAYAGEVSLYSLYSALSMLRRESPVHWVGAPGYNPVEVRPVSCLSKSHADSRFAINGWLCRRIQDPVDAPR
ncbi:hypothetical protein ACHZ98_28800 [Streptomyces sp. MAR4 CNY-716]